MCKSLAYTFSLLLAALLPVSDYAQQENSTPLMATRLALEITFVKGQPPSLYPVASQQAKPSGGWTLRFGRIADWKPPDGALPVRAVQVESRMDGNLVRVWVSVHLGKEEVEREEPVATLEMSEGKQVVITELTKFGVEPIEIKLVRFFPRTTVLPQIINQTNSVIVNALTAGTSTLPSYQLSLLNVSNKDVVALEVKVLVGGKIEIVILRQGEEGRSLIPAGKEYKLPVSGAYQVRPAYGDHPPDFTRDHDCVINYIGFRDGSFEGNAISASRYSAAVRGQKLQLAAVISLLQVAINSTDDAGVTLQRLKRELASLKNDVEEAQVKALFSVSPALSESVKSGLISEIRAGLTNVKRRASEELYKFEQSQNGMPDKPTVRSGLLTIKEKYEQWLARL